MTARPKPNTTVAAPTGHLFRNLIRFGRLLRDLGLDTRAGRMLEVAIALQHVDLGRRSDFYYTLQTLLVHRAQDLPIFEEAFRVFWRAPRGERTAHDLRAMGERRRFAPPEVDVPPTSPSAGAAPPREDPLLRVEQVVALSYSARQVSRTKDFATFSETEVAAARTMLSSLEWGLGRRVTRRWRAGAGHAIDIRRAVRHNLRFGGELVTLPRRIRRKRPRPLVLLCDVRGSMERYSRMLLHFVHTMAKGFDQVETFLFSTSLTRVTRRLSKRGVDDVVPTLPRHVPDWSGGTRIGEALRRFHVEWARRVMGHGPVVLLISDGWDRGDATRLGAEMARLQRRCHRLIWLNPLLGSPRYRPLTRGMQAALPWIDDFLPVHNLASLDALASHLNQLPNRRPPRRQSPVSIIETSVSHDDVGPAGDATRSALS
ncbi:MAG: VWA domain-containing protein [Acidobacteriota bacterium]|nr:VWA domain-containing protein [Acidobacteriota bacterium]